MRILIIGHPGSGKTYLADLLNAKTGIEKIDIDSLFDKHLFYFISKNHYRKALKSLLSDKNEWIIGGYHGKRMPDTLWQGADTIVFLNLPKDELKQNVRRRYKKMKQGEEFSHWQHTRINTLKNLGQIKFRDKSLHHNVARIKLTIDKNTKFYDLRSRKEIEKFINLSL